METFPAFACFPAVCESRLTCWQGGSTWSSQRSVRQTGLGHPLLFLWTRSCQLQWCQVGVRLRRVWAGVDTSAPSVTPADFSWWKSHLWVSFLLPTRLPARLSSCPHAQLLQPDVLTHSWDTQVNLLFKASLHTHLSATGTQTHTNLSFIQSEPPTFSISLVKKL